MDSYPGFSIPIFVTITIDDEKDHRFYWSNGADKLWSLEFIAPCLLPDEAWKILSEFRQFLDEMPNESHRTLNFQLREGGVGKTFPLHGKGDVIVKVSKSAHGSLSYSY